jgi:precorrin-6B methylase 2
MLFEWNDDTIRYYARAAEYTGFFRNLVAEIRGELDENSVVFDAGCGPGLIDMELAPYVRKVISADHNEGVIRYLKGEAGRCGITNIEAHIVDVMSCADMGYDTLLMGK